MMARKALLWVLFALTLASCAVSPVTDESSQFYRLPVGTAVVVNQDLTVPAGNARVFLQRGKVIAKNRLAVYQPHCNFEQRTVSDGTAVIKADAFKVTAVSVGDDLVVQSHAMVYVSLSMNEDRDGASMINRYVRYSLASPRQPQVMYLTCHGGFQMPFQAEYPSLIDIRSALGGLVTIQLP